MRCRELRYILPGRRHGCFRGGQCFLPGLVQGLEREAPSSGIPHDHVSLRAAVRARAGMLWTCSAGRESLESHQAAQRRRCRLPADDCLSQYGLEAAEVRMGHHELSTNLHGLLQRRAVMRSIGYVVHLEEWHGVLVSLSWPVTQGGHHYCGTADRSSPRSAL